MTLLIRNEEDLIAENILFHFKQGVDQFIVMDNLSSDKTVQIINDLGHFIPIKLISQKEDNYNQSLWVTSMARTAASKYEADWVINNDADEFWIFPGLDVKNYLKSFSKDIFVVELQRYNAALIEGNCWEGFDAHPCSSTLFEKRSLNSMGRPLPKKCLHRASTKITVAQGNHTISGFEGQIVKCGNARILHFPYRSFKNYQAKIRSGGYAYANNKDLNLSIGCTWREHYKIVEKKELLEFWKRLKYTKDDCISAKANGDLLRESILKSELVKLRRFWKQKQIERESKIMLDFSIQAVNQRIRECLVSVKDLHCNSSRSLSKNNLPYLIQGPLKHKELLFDLVESLSKHDPLSRFSNLRDIFSLFPTNQALLDWISVLLRIKHSHSVRRLRNHCADKNIVVYLSCQKYLERSLKSSISFEAEGYKSLIVIGSNENYPETLGFEFDGKILKLPVIDDYEHLGSKVFYAYLILSLCGKPKSVTKVDDDIELDDPKTFSYCLRKINNKKIQYFGHIISPTHRNQCHGWHIGKCSNKELNHRGYQYPMTIKYASGGFGYILGPLLIKECAIMYLSMQSFFEMNCIQLEDVFVGLAAQDASIEATNFEKYIAHITRREYPDVLYATLPGLKRNKN
ncbi:MAG: hypothetical protein CBC84_001630 [Pelagibacteraceae bacterium TMED124]|nr:MAG: hypothetical protein CBC84_001630 [Pelagibacteraceae bacterium TMED124]|tara:strand:- start:456 stop:2345 length:1890 start_codon:yes stop_codon:yes gene_type:complete